MDWKIKIKEHKKTLWLSLGIVAAILCIITAVLVYNFCCDDCVPTGKEQSEGEIYPKVPDYVTVDYIDPSRARTTDPLEKVNNIVIHYIGNPGTTAMQNRNYFDNPETTVCSHFIIGLDGEILQCIPLNEQSAASNQRNVDTVSIEVCHPDESGKFNDQTYASLVKFSAWLCIYYELDEGDLIRHHDITGKQCPKYFVDFPEEWENFKNDVKLEIEQQKAEALQ